MSRVKHTKRLNKMSYQRRNVVSALAYVPVGVELRQFPVVHVLQSLLGRVTAAGSLQPEVTQNI